MRNLLVIVVAVATTMLLVLSVQAGEVVLVGERDVVVEPQVQAQTSSLCNCEKGVNLAVTPNLPQGETNEPYSGPPDRGWVHLWAWIMGTLYFYHLDVI